MLAGRLSPATGAILSPLCRFWIPFNDTSIPEKNILFDRKVEKSNLSKNKIVNSLQAFNTSIAFLRPVDLLMSNPIIFCNLTCHDIQIAFPHYLLGKIFCSLIHRSEFLVLPFQFCLPLCWRCKKLHQ